MRKSRARRALRIAAVAAAVLLVAALAVAYYVLFYKSPEYRKLARETEETQRALDALADDADSGASPSGR